MKSIMLAAMILALAGCASSGPVPLGKDTYMISKQSAGGIFVAASVVKADILKEASAFCTSQNKGFEVITATETNAIPFARQTSAEAQFKCLDKSAAR